MSLSPTTGISKLSLESMPPTTRSSKEMDPFPEEDKSDRELEGDADESAEEDNGTTVRSPTRLKYNIERLSPRTQKLVRSLWGDSFEEPPEISLQWCDHMLDADGNIDFYAFQMHEVVPRSVRIGSPKSQYSEPQCQCGASKPCKHLIWLSDYIAQQALCDHNPQEPLSLSEHGYPDELGKPFQYILDMHLDVLADGLHCEIGHPLARSSPSPQRAAEAQSIIASIADADEHVFDSYRSDLTSTSGFEPRSLVHHKDAEATLFSLLVASHRLSAWLRSHLRPSDPARSPFRQIGSRARRIFADFDAFLAGSSSSAFPSPAGNPAAAADAEGACDASWAAASLTRCARQIHTLVSHPEAPLSPAERGDAARALVRILRGVVERQVSSSSGGGDVDVENPSLYDRLLLAAGGDGQGGGSPGPLFVAGPLGLLVDQGQFVDELEDIMAEVGRRGAAASWVAEMEAVVARMRAGRRRRLPPPPPPAAARASDPAVAAAGADGRAARQLRRRREVSPALGPVEHGAPGSAAASGVGIGASSAGTGGGAGTATAAGLSGVGYGGAGAASSSTAGSSSAAQLLEQPETRPAGSPSSRPGRGSGGRGGGRGASSSGGAGSKRSGGAGSGSEPGSKRAR